MMEPSFANEKLLSILYGLPLFLLVLYFSRRIEARKIARLGPGVTKYLAFKWSNPKFALRAVLWTIGLAAMLFSLAGPRLGFDYKEVAHGGRDIMVLFDVSRSMNAKDVSPTRMERAKRKILDVISGLRGERVGIVAFAGKAFVHCPLTDDKNMLNLFVNSLDDELISYQGTNLSEAVKIASESLEKGASAQSTGKSLLVLTDGEDFSGEILSVRSLVTAKNLELSVLGIGTPEGSPIPEKGGGLVKDGRGNLVISKLAEAELIDLTRAVGGLYVRSTAGGADVKAILEKVTARTDAEEISKEKVWNEYFQHALALGLLFLILGWMITPYQALPVAVVLLLSFSTIKQVAFGDGFGLFKQKKFEDAALYFEKEASTKDDNLLDLYNAAVSHYEAMEYDAAISGFKKASQSKNENLKRDALFNLANTLVAQNKLEESVAPYQESLKIDDDFVKAKENLEWVMKQLQEKKDKQENKDNKDNKDKQDQKQNPENKNPDDSSSKQDKGSSTDSKNQSGDQNSQSKSDPKSQNSDSKGQQGSSEGQQPSSESKDKKDEAGKSGNETRQDTKKADEPKDDQKKLGTGEEQAQNPHKKDKEQAVSQGEALKKGQPLKGVGEANALLRQVDENMKVWGQKPKFDDQKKDKDW